MRAWNCQVSALMDYGTAINLIFHQLVKELNILTIPCASALNITAINNQLIRECYVTHQTVPLELQVGLFYTEKHHMFVISSPLNPETSRHPH